MKTIALLTDLNRQGILTDQQLPVLSDLHLERRFSLHDELRACLYVGVLFILAGLGFTITTYFAQLGDIAVIGSIGLCTMGVFCYGFRKGNAYSKEAVAPPNMIFDYLLYAMVYGYAGLSIVVADILSGDECPLLIYFIFSSIGVVGSLYALSRKLREES